LPVVPTVATAMLGPAGASVAAIAHTALGALGNACESTLDTDMSGAAKKVIEGAPERGVLAVSALQTVLKLHKHQPGHPALQKIHRDMAEYLGSYGKVARAIPHLAKQLKPALISGAAIVGQTSYITQNKAPRSVGGERLPIWSTFGQTESASEPNAFEECILDDTKVVQGRRPFSRTSATSFPRASRLPSQFSAPALLPGSTPSRPALLRQASRRAPWTATSGARRDATSLGSSRPRYCVVFARAIPSPILTCWSLCFVLVFLVTCNSF
ncbi:hypothetical protein diail_9650, partial [Diaporthe ilicicola]